MTTVAYDGRYLSADTLSHRHNTPSNLLQSKIDLLEGFAYAVCGEWLAQFPAMIAWHRAGAIPADFPQSAADGTMLIVEIATRRLWIVSTRVRYLDEEAAPFSCGSGGDYALTAMDCDRTAMEAVQLASRRDLHTNDTIDFIDLEWPEKGVQRWEGYPSMKCPHPVRDDGIATQPFADEFLTINTQFKAMIGAPTHVGREPKPIKIDVGHLTGRFDEEDAPPLSAVYLPDYETPGADEYGFAVLKAFEPTRMAAAGVLCNKIGSYLDGFPHGGTIMWRVRPEVEAFYDMQTDKTDWKGYARLVVLPWKRAPLVAGMHPDVDVPAETARPSGKCDWAIGYPKPACGKCSTCLYVFGGSMNGTDEQPKSSIISREEVNRLFNPGLHAILAEDTDEDGNPRLCAHETVHALASGGSVIGAADVCTHGYVRRTCSSCHTTDEIRAFHKEAVAKIAAEVHAKTTYPA